MQIQIAEKSIIGSREEQQDAYCAYSSGNNAFAVVCDGMGGTAGGAAASYAAVNKLMELIGKKDPAETFPAFFLRAIDILDENVIGIHEQSGEAAAGTTIAAVAIEQEALYWLSVGDSRIYVIRGNEIVQVTRDHNYALSMQQWTKEELEAAENLPKKHRDDALISFIGVGGVKIYDINEAAFLLLSGDKILLTTDGLTKILEKDEIMRILAAAEISSGLDALFEAATIKANGAQDNTTSVLMQLT